MSEEDAVRERFARFARDEAPGRSELYAEWAAGVAADPVAQAILARIPATRRQPPLVFAVARLLGAPEGPYGTWADWLSGHADEVVAETSRRMLQTNEPLRCAALLPALSLVAGPVALLEVGASAGLCMYPDRYSYRYERGPSRDPAGGASGVVLHSRLTGSPLLRLPEVVWRGGIDLQPLDAGDEGDRAFLEALVWPGEEGRRARIAAALDVAAADPPAMFRGDASDPAVLADAAAVAPAGATLVVTTPGVLPHIPRAGRERLLAALARIVTAGGHWVTIDPPALHDAWRPPLDPARWDGFVLGFDGRPVAAVDPLGARVDWIG